MRETPRSRETAGDSGSERHRLRSGRASAHATGAAGPGSPHRSGGRPLQTPRSERRAGPDGRPGTTPPVPGRPLSCVHRPLPTAVLSSRRLRLGAAALFVIGFALATWQVIVAGPLLDADRSLDRLLVGHGPRALDEALSDLGSMPVALPVLALALAYALRRGARASVWAGAATMIVVPLLVVPLKIWTDRPGPLTDATGYYPSGHTATAMVAYGAAALVLGPYVTLRVTSPAAAVLTTATAVGLVLRGYHWPLDVVASGALCGVLLLALAAVLRRLDPRVGERSGTAD